MALRDAGHRVVNVACSLGRPEQRARREAELREACRLAGFELRLPAKPVPISRDSDPAAAHAELKELALKAITDLDPRIVLSPGPGDRHHGHRLVAGAVQDAISERGPAPPPLWMWALWGPLPQPTLGTLFDQARLEEILTALDAHRSELARNDFRRLVRGRAEMNAVLAAELLFGFGAETLPNASYAELLTEVVYADDRWLLGRPRWLDAGRPLCDPTRAEAVLG